MQDMVQEIEYRRRWSACRSAWVSAVIAAAISKTSL